MVSLLSNKCGIMTRDTTLCPGIFCVKEPHHVIHDTYWYTLISTQSFVVFGSRINVCRLSVKYSF